MVIFFVEYYMNIKYYTYDKKIRDVKIFYI